MIKTNKTIVKKKEDPVVLKIDGQSIKRGERKIINLEAGGLYDHTKLMIPLEVIRGKTAGPVLFISAAIHGDEINGVETVRRISLSPQLKKIKGTLILVPVVNVFGFNNKSRYLPDRRDLNRCFPGNKNGSLGSRMAYLFLKEVVSKCSYGIDLHTGAIHRTNYPHIRACIDDPITKKVAEGFGTSVIINSSLRDGSLRDAARKKGVSTLLFEGGEALRFEKEVIKKAVKGCLATMKNIGMLERDSSKDKVKLKKSYIVKDSYWLRASHAGIFTNLKKVGERVDVGDELAVISDLFGKELHRISASEEGILIGASKIPLVNKGDAMFHIATFKTSKQLDLVADYDAEAI